MNPIKLIKRKNNYPKFLKWGNNIEKIQELYRQGKTPGDIAPLYNSNRSAIKALIKRTIGLRSVEESLKFKHNNTYVDPNGLEYKEIQDLYKKEFTAEEISKILKIPYTKIIKILKETVGIKSRSEIMKIAISKGRIPTLLKKGDTGPKSPRWIPDRSKLKEDRMWTEERVFFKEVIAERNYICELTGIRGGKLSVHHIIPVHKNKELQYEKTNVIVVQALIHKLFHNFYGPYSTKEDWDYFVSHKEYLKTIEELRKEKLIKLPYRINLIKDENIINTLAA
jgi:hypothetical protein